jgi:hypothetical protein
MPDLQTMAEYEQRFRETYNVTGTGGAAELHFPCPFCASRDWYTVALLEFGRDMAPHYCVECERSAKLEFTERNGATVAKLVQVSGPYAPEWMPAPPQEVESSAFEIDYEERSPSAGHLEASTSVRSQLASPKAHRRKPPNLRDTHSDRENCATCKSMNRHTGVCQKFLWPVKPDQTCSAWTQRPKARKKNGKGKL